MDQIVSRATVKRTVRVPDEHRVLVEVPYRSSRTYFRVTHLIEELEMSSSADRKPSYSITVRGVVLTKAGKDHASHTGGRSYGGWSDSMADFPEALLEFTVGKGLMEATINPTQWAELSEI
jgi:hypothetical protein